MSESPEGRWSFGGAAPVRTAAGTLTPGMLLAGAGGASLEARLVPAAPARRLPVFDDVTVVDDRGTRYALACTGMSSGDGSSWLRLSVEPVPQPDREWLELRNQDGESTRLLRATGPTDPPDRSRPMDIAADLRIDDTVLRVDSLGAGPDAWQVHLRVEPGWWSYSDDGQYKRAVVQVHAEDDLGGRYESSFGGSSGDDDHEDVALRFQPDLDPRAGAVTLVFSGPATQADVRVRL